MSTQHEPIRVGDRFQTSDGDAWIVMLVRPFGVCTLTTEDFRYQSDFCAREVREMNRLEGHNKEIIRRMNCVR
jgi:hypothetical protein